MDCNEMNQGSIHGTLPDISLSFDRPEVNNPLNGKSCHYVVLVVGH